MNYLPKNYTSQYKNIEELESIIQEVEVSSEDFISVYSEDPSEVDTSKMDKHLSSVSNSLISKYKDIREDFYESVENDLEIAVQNYIFAVEHKIEEDEFPFSEWIESLSEIGACSKGVSLVKENFLKFLEMQDKKSDIFKYNLSSMLLATSSHIKEQRYESVFAMLNRLESAGDFEIKELLFASDLSEMYSNIRSGKSTIKTEKNLNNWFFEYANRELKNYLYWSEHRNETYVNEVPEDKNIRDIIEKIKNNGENEVNRFFDYLLDNRIQNNFFKFSTLFNNNRNTSSRKLDSIKLENIKRFVDNFIIKDFKLTEIFVDKILIRLEKLNKINVGLESEKKNIQDIMKKALTEKLNEELKVSANKDKKIKI